MLAGSIGLVALQSRFAGTATPKSAQQAVIPGVPADSARAESVVPAAVAESEPAAEAKYDVEQSMDAIEANDLRAHVEFLADDLLEGRDTGSRGARVAANYIKTCFQRFGLEPVGDEGTFFQRIPFRKKAIANSSQMKVEINGEMVPLNYKSDFLVVKPPHRSGEPLTLASAFAGFGIRADEYDYDDYRDLDVAGKAVIYLGGEPASGDTAFFAGERPTKYSRSRAKRRLAGEVGAAASVSVFGAREAARFSWNDLQRFLARPGVQLDERANSSSAGDIPAMVVSADAAELLFADEGQSYADLDRMAEKGALQPFAMKKKLEFKINFTDEPFEDNNVVGYLEGSDPALKSEVIVITAHYDHVGIGTPVAGDSVYNGAADNASGVAGLLELAEAFSSLPQAPRRSLLFLAVTGEEKGLLGSRYYVEHPIYPLKKTVANFNLDMIGLGDSTAMVVFGGERSSLGENVRKAAEALGVAIYPDEIPEERVFYRSDHYSFARKGVPAVLPSFGMHREWMSEFRKFYHRPSDDKNLRWLNYNNMRQHVRVVFAAALEVANAENAPRWVDGDEFGKVRQASH